MGDELELRLALQWRNPALVLSKTQSDLITRGRRDAAALSKHPDSNQLLVLSKIRSLSEAGDNDGARKLLATLGEKWDQLSIWIEPLCEQGNADARFVCGLFDFYDGGDALREFWNDADATIQFILGNLYADQYRTSYTHTGICEHYYQRSLHWYRRAADQGHQEAQRKLHHFAYCPGGPAEGTEWRLGQIACVTESQDLAEVAASYRVAGDNGDPFAQLVLGHMYYCGRGVPQDQTEALNWYRRSAEQGNGYAQLILGDMLLNSFFNDTVTPWEVKKARDWSEAARWLREAHDQGIGPVWMYFEMMDEPLESQPGRPWLGGK